MKVVKAIIITGFGINCEEEMAAAYKLAGAEANIVHLNEIFAGNVNIHEYDILNFPGGFSYGDDLGSGKVLANKMKYRKLRNGRTFLSEINSFVNSNKFILGICNGFQFLVKMGLLPNIYEKNQQEVTLTRNNSAKFEDRWVYLKANPKSKTPFLKGIDTIFLPVRHGEGKLITKNGKLRTAIKQKNLNCLSYCDEQGNISSQYPENPNGSEMDCAGLTDKTGNILGMMPHPEAFLSLYNHPDWHRLKRMNSNISEEGDGLELFKNIVQHIKKEELNGSTKVS
ncbi:MAG: phosphoribosylformylglycinamidine synthase subunit PurQ [Candidatus Cloacimonadota bacterium]|nr:phosphoribosylformylglycinamidine synthase subunit PurQ [Candidatus Cloacimonadota bacterium]